MWNKTKKYIYFGCGNIKYSKTKNVLFDLQGQMSFPVPTKIHTDLYNIPTDCDYTKLEQVDKYTHFWVS